MKNNIQRLKNIFYKFPITYICSVFISVLYVILFNHFNNAFDILFNFIFPFGITTFLIETILINKNKKIYYLIPIFIGLIFLILTRFNDIINNHLFIRLEIFYYISIFLLAIYLNYKNTKKSFSKYLISCFSNLLKTFFNTVIITIGLLIIIWLINLLILNRNILNDYENILVLVLGIYFIPSCIFSIYKYYEVNEFIKILVSKILFILILISYIVIYIYIFKILLTLTMPSNIVFRILSLLFIISMIVSIMSYDIENNNILIKINKLLPYLFIPFVFLQCYCLGVRIIDNGFTIFRYLGVMLIIFEIIYIIFHIINKDKALLIFVIIFELVITLIIPFINCYDFSIYSQYKYLLEYKNSNEVTNKIKSSYEYLNNFSKGKTLIKNLLTKEQIDLINKFDFENNNFYYYDNNINLIDIEGYKTLEYIYENSDIESNYPIIVEKMYNCYNGKVNDCFENNNVFILDNKKIIIKYANVDDNYYSIEYYLLKK